MRPRRISFVLLAAVLFALGPAPAGAQRPTDNCDRCMATHPCGDELQACFLDCRGRFSDPTNLDTQALFDSCNTDCNRRFSICNGLAQQECRRDRACF